MLHILKFILHTYVHHVYLVWEFFVHRCAHMNQVQKAYIFACVYSTFACMYSIYVRTYIFIQQRKHNYENTKEILAICLGKHIYSVLYTHTTVNSTNVLEVELYGEFCRSVNKFLEQTNGFSQVQTGPAPNFRHKQ